MGPIQYFLIFFLSFTMLFAADFPPAIDRATLEKKSTQELKSLWIDFHGKKFIKPFREHIQDFTQIASGSKTSKYFTSDEISKISQSQLAELIATTKINRDLAIKYYTHIGHFFTHLPEAEFRNLAIQALMTGKCPRIEECYTLCL